MSGRLYLNGEIRPVDFEVDELGMFAFSFSSGVSSQIDTIDRLIQGHKFFSMTPDYAKVSFIGTIRKMLEIRPGIFLYEFVVHQIVAIRGETE